MTNRSKFYLPKGVKVEWLFQIEIRREIRGNVKKKLYYRNFSNERNRFLENPENFKVKVKARKNLKMFANLKNKIYFYRNNKSRAYENSFTNVPFVSLDL